MISAGKKFRQAITENKPLMVVGTINAYAAMLAKSAGHQAIYLSGAGVANASYGIPDLGITSLEDVLIDARRICNACDLPLLVDIDTGWGGAFNIARTIRELEGAGVAAVHIEDQVTQKRCGHRPNKELVTTSEMVDRLKAAVDGRTNADFFIMARTDAYANEGIEGAVERSSRYLEAGADGIFLEAVHSLDEYKVLREKISAPILANITEFGKTPLLTAEELASAGVDIMLFPLSAFRAMSKSAEEVYNVIAQQGTQQDLLGKMQTRDELYKQLDYHSYENTLDNLFKK
ncbi:MAG: 2-methylisocitrate lyase [Pseudomonadota bacterium]